MCFTFQNICYKKEYSAFYQQFRLTNSQWKPKRVTLDQHLSGSSSLTFTKKTYVKYTETGTASVNTVAYTGTVLVSPLSALIS